ncbi:hypothetical protein FM124_02885 [Pediococcus acidilactici]|nr:hypothetical protein FM124_02885 [Pediococcus acidilactici]
MDSKGFVEDMAGFDMSAIKSVQEKEVLKNKLLKPSINFYA